MLAIGSTTASIDDEHLHALLDQVAQDWVIAAAVKRLLLVPPDHTRLHSKAGQITAYLWQQLQSHCSIDIMPALGTHQAMTAMECEWMFGAGVPFDAIQRHQWREQLTKVGEIGADETAAVSQGRFQQPLRIEVNRRLVSGDYDLIISLGQVVPHEVIGFANYTKNICVGLGGPDTIHKTHFMGAVCGMESIMGQVDTPVRQIIDTAFERFVRPRANVKFLLTVVEATDAGNVLRGVFGGADRDCYEAAAGLSAQVNITHMDDPCARCVVYLDPREYHSTWLGNKAIYRTRMCMADGGRLTVLAPGVERFGEDDVIDQLIRRHGYCGTDATLKAIEQDPQLRDNLSAAAHLIHGSSEGRFDITYCTPAALDQQAIEEAGFRHQAYADVAGQYDVQRLQNGWHTDVDDQPFYFIRNPAVGLWMTKDRSIT